MTDKLPELPESEGYVHYPSRDWEPEWTSSAEAYTADQLRSYAEEAVRLEREAIRELALQKSATFPADSDYHRGYALAKQDFAAAIRARSEVIDDSASPIN